MHSLRGVEGFKPSCMAYMWFVKLWKHWKRAAMEGIMSITMKEQSKLPITSHIT